MDDRGSSPRLPQYAGTAETGGQRTEKSAYRSVFSSENLSNFLGRYIFHTDRTEFQENLFRVYLQELATPIIRGALFTLLILILVTWPTDYFYFQEQEIIRAYGLWRIFCVIGIGIYIYLLNQLEILRKRIFESTYLCVLLATIFTGFVFGVVKDLQNPWFYAVYALPASTVFFSFKIIARVVTTCLLTVLYAVAYFVAGMVFNPGGLYLDYPHLDLVINITVLFMLLDIGLGHMIYHLSRSNFFESRTLKLQQQRVRELADHDDLTGLYNHWKITERLKQEENRSHRYDQDLSVAILDLDHFKRINDRYGHQTGDEILKRVASCLRELTRISDSVGRYGGEEFCLILPETPLNQAKEICHEVKNAISEIRIPQHDEDGPHLTCSIGLTVYKGDQETGKNLLDRADRALYEAKEKGRDRVITNENGS